MEETGGGEIGRMEGREREHRGKVEGGMEGMRRKEVEVEMEGGKLEGEM